MNPYEHTLSCDLCAQCSEADGESYTMNGNRNFSGTRINDVLMVGVPSEHKLKVTFNVSFYFLTIAVCLSTYQRNLTSIYDYM